MYKKLVLILLFLSNLFNYVSIAQYGSNEFPPIGKNFIMAISQIYPQKKIGIRDLGSDTWDLSMFNPTDFDTIRMKMVKKTRYGKRFPDANVAMVYNKFNMEYLSVDSGRIYLTGLIGDFMEKKIPVLLRFKDPLLYKNPHLMVDQQYSDTSETYFAAPYMRHPNTDSIKAEIQYIRTGRVDASGKLITPLGEYQVQREVIFIEKRVRGYKYSMFGWTPAPEYSLQKHYTMYRWYTKESKIPMAEAILNDEDYIEYVSYQYNSPLRLTFSGRDVNCKGGSNGFVDLTVTGGIPDYKYEWTHGSRLEDLRNVKAGTYRVNVTDNRGEKISSYYTVTEPLVKLEAKIDVKNISCRGQRDGKVKLNIVGGLEPYDFIWSNDSVNETVTGLLPGNLYVKVIDAGRCVIIDSVEITQPEKKLSAKIEREHVTCFKGRDGIASILANGGTPPYRYQWFDNDTGRVRKNLPAGTHKVTVFDKNNCSVSKEVEIDQPASPIKITETISNIKCHGGADGKIELEISGGKAPYHLLWADNSESRSLFGIKAGEYDLKLTDRNGCVVERKFEVKQPSAALSISHTKKDVNCFNGEDGEAAINVSGGTPGYTFLWSNQETKNKAKKLRQGIYDVKVSDKNNCHIFDTIEILAPENPIAIESEKTDVKCYKGNDGTIKVDASGGTPPYIFNWSNKKTGKEITNIKAGKYSITVTDKNKCILQQEFEITSPQSPITIQAELLPANCHGEKTGAIRLRVSGGEPEYYYKWPDGTDSPDLFDIPAGAYMVEITDSRKCIKTQTFNLQNPDKILVKEKLSLPQKGKANGLISIEVKGGTKPYNIIWSSGAVGTKAENLAAGKYDVEIRDAKDCILIKEFELSEKEGSGSKQ